MTNHSVSKSLIRFETAWAAAGILLILISMIGTIFVGNSSALQITNRKVTLSNSAGAATGVTYTSTSDALPTTGTSVKSMEVLACETASGGCTTPSGFSASASTLASQPTGLGCAAGWTANTATAGSLRIVNAGCATNPSGAVSVQWDGVANPTANNSTYYLRVTTYSGAAWSGVLDSGVVAVSTSRAFDLSGTIDETLTFCTGTSGITNSNCSGATGSSIAFGTLSASSTNTGISQIGVGTNAQYGYAITVNGNTLTSAGNTISALGVQTASSAGTEQFGLNLRDNATPNIGTDPDGAGTASPSANYNTADQYRFVTGDTVASKSSADNFRRFHASYIANINTASEAGTYNATLTYIATATY